MSEADLMLRSLLVELACDEDERCAAWARRLLDSSEIPPDPGAVERRRLAHEQYLSERERRRLEAEQKARDEQYAREREREEKQRPRNRARATLQLKKFVADHTGETGA